MWQIFEELFNDNKLINEYLWYFITKDLEVSVI